MLGKALLRPIVKRIFRIMFVHDIYIATRRYYINYMERSSLYKKCGVKLPYWVEVKNGENIYLKPDIALGTNAKLLCTTKFLEKKYSPRIQIGYNFHATRNFTVQCANNIEIGNDVLVASDVFIIDFNHGLSADYQSYLETDLEFSDVIIEDGVWLGNSVTILSGVRIGKKSIIAAGSVVTHNIPPYSIAAGNPAKVIKRWNKDDKRWMRI